MQGYEMYVFDRHNRLVGAQNVSNFTLDDVAGSIEALKLVDRTAIVSDKGRSVCCVCYFDLGECEVPAGKLSPGYCTPCFNAAHAEIENLR